MRVLNQFIIFELIIDLAPAKIWIPLALGLLFASLVVCFSGRLSSCTCILAFARGAGWFLGARTLLVLFMLLLW